MRPWKETLDRFQEDSGKPSDQCSTNTVQLRRMVLTWTDDVIRWKEYFKNLLNSINASSREDVSLGTLRWTFPSLETEVDSSINGSVSTAVVEELHSGSTLGFQEWMRSFLRSSRFCML